MSRCVFHKHIKISVIFDVVLWLIIMALYPRQIWTFSSDAGCTFCLLFAIRHYTFTVLQCDIEHATLEFHNATLKFDSTTLLFYATFQLRIFNLTPAIRHA